MSLTSIVNRARSGARSPLARGSKKVSSTSKYSLPGRLRGLFSTPTSRSERPSPPASAMMSLTLKALVAAADRWWACRCRWEDRDGDHAAMRRDAGDGRVAGAGNDRMDVRSMLDHAARRHIPLRHSARIDRPVENGNDDIGAAAGDGPQAGQAGQARHQFGCNRVVGRRRQRICGIRMSVCNCGALSAIIAYVVQEICGNSTFPAPTSTCAAGFTAGTTRHR